MKIVCDACQAKYSISDDKVQGKVFKIRCKKCSNIIVVRGAAAAAEPAPQPAQEKDTRVFDYGYDGAGQPAGDDAVWHVVINQDQVGPLTAAEVQQRFAAGEIDGDTYAWREGFADWMPLAQVDTFAALVASGTATTAAEAGAGAAAVSSMFGTGGDDGGTVRSDPGDLFAAASAGSAHARDDDGDLFGSRPSASAASAQPSGTKLRGERNENSVLFSLNNLAQLASDKPAASAPASTGHATGAAGGEGSGLIDIRSMASAYLGSAGAAAKPASAGVGSIDDLPVFGGGGFSEPAVIVPVPARASNNKMMYALIGSVAALAITVVIVLVVLLTGDKGGGTQVAANTAPGAGGDDPAAAKVAEDKVDEAKPDDKPAEAAAAAAEAATPKDEPAEPAEEKAAASAAEDKPSADKSRTADKPRTTTTRTTSRTETKPRTTATKPKEPSGGGCDEISCVLNNYEGSCCAKFKKSGSKPSAGGSSGSSDLPRALDRAMIQAGVSKVKGRVTTCGAKSSAKGEVKVSVKVSPAGKVTSVSVTKTPDAGLGNCVAAAMKGATFAKTQNGGSFAYPWRF